MINGCTCGSVSVVSSSELRLGLETLFQDRWKLESPRLWCQLDFAKHGGHLGLTAFLSMLALVSERLGHQCEEVYIRNGTVLTLRLSTPNAEGVTQKDFELAWQVDKFAASAGFGSASSRPDPQLQLIPGVTL